MKTNTEKLNFRDERVDGSTLITKAGDVFTIIIAEGVISNSIEFKLTNKDEGEEFYVDSIPNKLQAWKMLRDVNDMLFRTVLVYNERENRTDPFEQSAPYIYRFVNS